MAGIKDYSSTAANNSSVGGVSIAEGMLPSNINNAFRAFAADIREFYNDSQWVIYGDGDGSFTAAYASATSFTISGSNVNTTHTAAASGSSAVNGGVGILTYDDHGVGSVGTLAVTQSQGCSTNSSGTTTCTGGSFSFANSFTQGDAINGSSTTWGDITTYSGGTAGGGQPGTITNGHAITLDNGSGSTGTIGAGNSLTGQFVSEITIFD